MRRLVLSAAAALLAATTAFAPAAAADASKASDGIRVPPSTTLRYEMERGLLRGTGDLSWQNQGDHYELRFEGRVAGLNAITQVSTGALDAGGVAPQRFTDKRLGRSGSAAEFRRDADHVTVTGLTNPLEAQPSVQDRLSWMVQLGALVAADPQRARPGAKVAMQVVGTRADASLWAFRCVGPEAVPTAAGRVDAIKYVREPRDPGDTSVQVWLDPRRHHLPVRAVQQSGPDDEPFDLRLKTAVPAN
ncbi:MAG: DUF3108 domain-containing protein [Burkholderiaceae bacterium]